jgi:hypothetical protein
MIETKELPLIYNVRSRVGSAQIESPDIDHDLW